MGSDSRKSTRVLIVDDDKDTLDVLAELLGGEGYAVQLAADGRAALALVAELPPDVIVTDLGMPHVDGMGVLAGVREKNPALPVIVVTSNGELDGAVAAMRAGASDYLTKPVNLGALLVSIERALEERDVRMEAENLRRQVRDQAHAGLEGLIGSSAPMQAVYRMARHVAPSRATVLITGESGTGKGELARSIHAMSPRAQKPFVSLHCASLAESLLESELFGHEKGAFTGADRRRVGRFEAANGGTLLLDEVGEIPMQTQVKLLGVLQERAIERVGGNETIKVDVRLIAATNRDLATDVREGKFREDLYYRLNVLQVEMPPLRMRGTDVITLAEHFLHRFALENHKRLTGFSDGARAKILASRWPGNVRALENAMERAVIMCETDEVTDVDLAIETSAADGEDGVAGLRVPGATMRDVERYVILKTLEAVGGSTTRAAEMLDIGVRTIQYRLHEYGAAKKS